MLRRAMALISARGLHKAFGPQAILEDVSLSIEAGERVGLVGVNGSGKSTLARILAGLESPDSGELVRKRDARIAYLPQIPALQPGRTVIDEVLSGLAEWSAAKARFDQLSAELERRAAAEEIAQLLARQSSAAAELERLGGWEVRHRARAMLGHLGVEQHEAPVEQLSGGEQRRVALARLLVGRPQLALLDEPTNHLDLAAIEWLEAYLRDELVGGLLLVTHDRYLLDRVTQRTLELERSRLHAYAGGYRQYLEAKAERLAHEGRAEANRQRFVRQELAWLQRQPKARTGKQKARIQRAEQAIGEAPTPQQREIQLELHAPRSSKRVLELKQLGLQLGGRALVRELDFLLLHGQRLGIVGPNGCGKTTLLRAITGEISPSHGAVLRSKNTAVAYLDQTRATLDEGASVVDAVADGERKVHVGGRAVDVEAFLARLLFPVERLEQKVSSLSGGERTRVALARMICQPANLVILDEPTNDLDVPTIAALEQLLIEQASTAIVVTHDRWFLDRVATALLVFEGAGRVTPYEGNYEIYCRLRRRQQRAPAQRRAAAPSQPAARGQPAIARPPRLTYDEQRELEGLLERVEQAEAHVAALEARLSDPATYAHASSKGQDVAALAAELEQARQEAAELLARWEALEQKRDAAKGARPP